ncbi:MAG: hypothetical protein Q8O62_02440 [Aequorivita sp.]|nr:hypothetical protein [Aequorivita sp.]
MENEDEVVRQKMRELITESCRYNKQPTKEFQKFHKTLLNFFFNSIDLNIDYENKFIYIRNSKPLTTDPVRFYDLNEAISDNVDYTNLEETLIGCLEDGHLQTTFYKKILFEYGDFLPEEENFLSA